MLVCLLSALRASSFGFLRFSSFLEIFITELFFNYCYFLTAEGALRLIPTNPLPKL
jgi:hypothetical protein